MTVLLCVVVVLALNAAIALAARYGFKLGRADGESAVTAANAIAAQANASSATVLDAARANSGVGASLEAVAEQLRQQNERFKAFADSVEGLDSNVAVILTTLVNSGLLRRAETVDAERDRARARRSGIDDVVPPPLDAPVRPLEGVMR